MDYDLYITFMGADMGITPIYLDQSGSWEMCDACYPLADEIGCDGHNEMIVRIFSMLLTESNPDGVMHGSFDGITFKVIESGSIKP